MTIDVTEPAGAAEPDDGTTPEPDRGAGPDDTTAPDPAPVAEARSGAQAEPEAEHGPEAETEDAHPGSGASQPTADVGAATAPEPGPPVPEAFASASDLPDAEPGDTAADAGDTGPTSAADADGAAPAEASTDADADDGETGSDPDPAGRRALAAGLRGHALVPMAIVLAVAVIALAVVARLSRPAAVAEADPTVPPATTAHVATAPARLAPDDVTALAPLPRLLPPPPPATPVWLPPRPLAEPLSRVPTPNKVIFLGIDDGLHRDPAALDYLWLNHIPFAVFLTMGPAKEDPAFWRQVVAAGGTIESHTLTHPDLRKVGAKALQDEVCGTADTYQAMFGRRPTLFRPPFGSYDERVRRVAMSCGYQTLVMWYGSTNNGRLTMQQGPLHPGDIILMHWRPDLLDNLHDVVARCQAEGFTIARLEDYLSPGR